MRYVLFALVFLTSPLLAKTHSAEHYLKHKISSKDKRYPSFRKALELLQKRGAKTLVETGTARCGSGNYVGDGGSTIIFAQWAKDHDAEFYSVDINQKALNLARSAVHKEVKYLSPNFHFVCSDSIAFLQNFGKPIDFLYMDSYDCDENNLIPSQQHHLLEIAAAYPFLAKNSVVLIDDCQLPGGGKGKLAINFLLDRGWKILEDQYQVLLIYPK